MDNTYQEFRRIKNSDLIEVWISSPKSEKCSKTLHQMKSLLNITECCDSVNEKLEQICEAYCLALSRKWKECSRNKHYLFKRHHEWLNKEVNISEDVLVQKKLISREAHPGPSRGRPQVPFADASIKTKKRRLQDLISSRSHEELSFAAELSQKSTSISKEEHCTVSPHAILALYLDLDLSERKYAILRTFVNSLHKGCFPNVKVLRQMKRSFLPSKISATEISAEVDLQDLLNVTTKSILQVANIGDSTDIKLVCKWGFDGSSGHSIYKQKFTQSSCQTDEFMFLVALVPLKLVNSKTNSDLWVNSRPSSTFFCRPIKFIFIKEDAKLVREQESLINMEIENLSPFVLNLSGRDVKINFQFHFTMLDGSVANILSDTHCTSKCFICGASPVEMNLKRVAEKLPKTEHYRFGLSTLHCWIRFFECLLHISYRLPFKKWQVRGDENKEVFANNKKRIQEELKNQLGLIVDKPKPGYGSTNDGNTARRFFGNSETSSQITGIDKNLIDKFCLILRVLSSGKKINISTFRVLLKDTLDLYLGLYSWYYMPSSVHKVLIHGCDVIDFFDLPIGLLSEEALEARHKEVRKNRLHHARKTSRKDTNIDLMNALLLTSDPLISTHRKATSTKSINRDFSDIVDYIIDTDPPQVLNELDLELDIHDLSDTETEYSE